MDDIGQFLFLLAFVIIAAIQWVVKTIQDRRNPAEPEEEDPLEETWRELEEHHENERLRGDAESPQFYKEAEPERPAETSPINELRNLFESLKKPEPVPEPVPEPIVPAPRIPRAPVVATPPPVVEKKRVIDPRSGLSAAEREALDRLGKGGPSSRIRRKKRVGTTGFRQMLRGTGNLRQALILKEVFDQPIALRKETTDQSFLG